MTTIRPLTWNVLIALALILMTVGILAALLWRFLSSTEERTTPTMIVIDRQNVVRRVHVGASPNVGDELREALEDLLPAWAAGEWKPVQVPKPEGGLES